MHAEVVQSEAEASPKAVELTFPSSLATQHSPTDPSSWKAYSSSG